MVARALPLLLLLTNALAACASRPPLAGTGDAGPGLDGQGAGADAGSAPDGAAGGADADATVQACSVDTDCVLTGVTRPVATVSDCYCADPCPFTVLNRAAAAPLQEQWDRLCGGLPEFTAYCPLAMCGGPHHAFCWEGRCRR
jgi:hypothetical protein